MDFPILLLHSFLETFMRVFAERFLEIYVNCLNKDTLILLASDPLSGILPKQQLMVRTAISI